MPKLPIPKGSLRWAADGATFYRDAAAGLVYTLVGPSVFSAPVYADDTFATEDFSHAYHDAVTAGFSQAEGGPWDRAAYEHVRDILLGRVPPPDPKPKKADTSDHVVKCPYCGNTDKDRMHAPNDDDVACCHVCGAAFDVDRPETLEGLVARVVAVVGATPQSRLRHCRDILFSCDEEAPNQDAVQALIRLLVAPI